MLNTRLFLLVACTALFVKCGSSPEPIFDIIAQTPIPERIYNATPWPDRIFQSIAEDPSTQISISWRASNQVITGYVEYTEAGSFYAQSNNILTKAAIIRPVRHEHVHDHYFQADISGLKPETNYKVRVGNDSYRSEWIDVRTAPESFKPFRFLYFGDMQSQIREKGTGIFRHAAMHYHDARFMVHAGDLVSSSGDDDTWGEWFYAGNWLFQQVPSLVVAGNSDHFRWQQQPVDKQMLFPQWHGVFNMPKNNPEGLENLAYYFDYPGIRIIALYSNFESLTGNNRDIYIKNDLQLTQDLFNQQLRWLERALAGNRQPWLAVVIHHPVFTARKERYNELLQNHFLPLFEKYKVDLVMQGHDHVYARGSNPDPEKESKLPVYVISVAGGEMREVDRSHTWISRYKENTQLYQVIHIGRNALRLESVDTRGNIADRFWIRRAEDGSKVFLE